MSEPGLSICEIEDASVDVTLGDATVAPTVAVVTVGVMVITGT